jgi:16S rRNA processing protein RimM
MTEYFKIGKLVSAFGLKGELILKHNLGKKTSLKGLQAIFVEERKESFIPYFIESTRIKAEDEIYIQLEGVNVREVAVQTHAERNMAARSRLQEILCQILTYQSFRLYHC